ncbi:6-phosphogluconolactonase [Thalassobius vesicularis]|uniref:6-phosphogluconolactonase n=1 Tax=Thalassobius vesicularis TaxID=1294297 RepID=A0A4S3M8P7_9RHOB|nr:6-phosphogluconolactonase [Thalassobius vesicularis]THD73451.1 6-phosphogluconolactonase [Thalassobius vesicularis]
MKLIDYADRDMLAIDLAQQLAGELTAALMHEERATLIVPGGTTPAPIFDALCAADLDWARVDVMPSDERWVPEDHPRSNGRLIRERLLVGRAAAARFLPLYATADTPELALGQLEQVIRPYLPAAVALLGMGEDMHTASLFPDADGLAQALAADAPSLVAIRTAAQPEPRVSLSARALRGSLSLHLVITGQAKRDALSVARNQPPERAPVATILENAEIHWAA